MANKINVNPDPKTYPIFPDLKGKIALIMGVGQVKVPNSENWGNGAAIARVLSHNGVKIFGCDLNIAAAEFTASRLRAEGGEVDVMAADVTVLTQVEAVVQGCLKRYGRIDILINNVGMTRPGDPATMDPKMWIDQLTLNLTSAYNSCHVVLPIMEAQQNATTTGGPGGCCIVNNASLTALRYLHKPQVAYATAKAGLLQFTRHTAAIYASRGVRLNCVVPGLIMTPLVENLGVSDRPEDNEVFRQIVAAGKAVPMARLGSAFDVAFAAVFLCSEVAAGYVTGQEIVVDGGAVTSAPA